ncbi:MAG: hypothetical protein HKN42_13930 [Granulosicoccus sp.]|nr:hypothetical protein [Granulosicoccus sp.]
MAAELATPDGEVLLTISGNIGLSNSENGAEFDLAMLEQLGAESITTRTPWTDGPTLFTGVRLNVLLDAVMARSHSFRALAIDDYWFDFNDIDIEKYPIIVSYKQNDSLMTARNLGPLWIMFPFDDYPELLSEVNKAACVWQLNSLVVR